MPVLCTTFIPGLDAATYNRMGGQLAPALLDAPGFVNHIAYPADGGWTVSEIWDSESEFRSFFDATVAPNLPPGSTPVVVELHRVLTAGSV